MIPGCATTEATAAFAEGFAGADFYRRSQSLTVSTLGIGTYLGPMTDAVDDAYAESVLRALRGGVNLIDTSLNYRHQRSERAIRRGLAAWFERDGGSREAALICTKAGYLVPDAVPAKLNASAVVGGMHCLDPVFLEDQLERSRANLGLETIDVFYLHNPETQLAHVSEEEFYSRIGAAFETLERLAGEGRIRYYGAATWDGFRRGSKRLSLTRMADLATQVGGSGHKFRFIQLPLNLAMTEALSKPLEADRTVLDLAGEFGVTVICSASLLQARLSRGLPDEIAAAMPGVSGDALRAIQFTRSAPGVTAALVGMSNPEHVTGNLDIRQIPPLSSDEFRRAFFA